MFLFGFPRSFAVSVALTLSLLWPGAPAFADPVVQNTHFDPDIHGWPFANEIRTVCSEPLCLEGNPFSPFSPLPLSSHAGADWALCGGMSFSALRRFQNSTPVEIFSDSVRDELVDAQLETVAASWSGFVALSSVIQTPGHRDVEKVTAQSWESVRASLNAGLPVVIGLIYSRSLDGASVVFENHQVLAIGYETDTDNDLVRLAIYDPNFPTSAGWTNRASSIEFELNEERPFNSMRQVLKTDAGAGWIRCWVCTKRIYGFFPIVVDPVGPNQPLQAPWAPAIGLLLGR